MFESKTQGIIYSGLAGCIVVLLFLSLALWRLYENKVLEISKLEAEKQILLANEKELLESIDKQNKIFKELEVKETLVDNSKLLEIYIKDESCESELKAYKQLFKELGR